MTYPHIHSGISSGTVSSLAPPLADWHVLVLWADDTESTLKGLWGPYTNIDVAEIALAELRQWPLDGRWDLRRLNKFVALKAAAGEISVPRFSWQS
jgi:hypothetical protein